MKQFASVAVAVGLTVSPEILIAQTTGSDITVSRPHSTASYPYVGLTLGMASYDDMDDSDVAFNLWGGYRVNEVLAVEAGWMSLGDVSKSGTSAEVSLLHLDVLAFIGLNSDVNLFGKVGLANWNYDFTAANNTSTDDSGVDLGFGFGLNYQVSANAIARFGFDFFTLDPELSAGTKRDEDITAFYGGVILTF